MTSPPSSLPSPVPSTSSSHHPHTFSSLAMPPPAGPNRTHSATSGFSATSGRESKGSGFLSNGSAGQTEELYSNGTHEFSHQTPQPHHNNNGGYPPGSSQHPYLPPVTSSPPPQVRPYVPPPQHAMAPDPIHTMMQPGVTSPGGMVSPTQSGWNGSQNGWRGPSSQSGFPPSGQQFARQLPNGHLPPLSMQHQLPPNPNETFVGRGPLSAFGGMNGRPGSRQGESRERRRGESREDRDGEEEVITTIFVVGFPDDMLEREFQNFFAFAPGFEAATLKFPSGSSRSREPAAALLAELQQLAANQVGEHGEPLLSPPLEEAIAALQLSSASSSSTTPSAAMSMTPSGPTGPVLANQPYGSSATRRQTIGFARFKTRADALAAREHLQGRKIDALTGATLKAEMAKKNLHTKRTTSGEELVGLLLRSGRLAGLIGGAPGGGAAGINPNMINGLNGIAPHLAGPHQHQSNPQSAGYPSSQSGLAPNQSAREAWDSWPLNGQMPNDERSEPQSIPQTSSYQYQDGQNASRQQQQQLPQSQQQQQQQQNQQHQPSASAPSTASTSPPLSITSPNTRPTDSKALLALAEEADEMEGWNMGGPGGMGYGAYMHGHPGHSQPQPINYPNQGQGFGMGGSGREAYGSSPLAGSDHLSDAGRSMGGVVSGPNPADQNPPINTLYVGNLPAISPPTLPPNFLEESLRVLFQTCPGYKRMSFRQKINGPMCFVEFEDVGYAANAIQSLYGHSLNGLVKGGIRLSYSKNSLGQRGIGHPAGGNGQPFGGIAHTVAQSAMTQNVYGAPSAPPNNSTFGLQLHGHGQSAPSGPSTAPIPVSSQQQQQHAQSAPSGQPSTSLSPNAQPFALPSTSPRSRYFGPTSSAVPVPVPNASGDQSAPYHAFQNASTSPGAASGQFSPVRTPASFSWVSSGSGVTGNGGFVLGSLDGAASAWGSTPSSGGNTGIGQANH